MAKAERELTEQEERWCLEYVRCWSVAEACRRAGCSAPTGYRLARDPAIKWRCRELAKEMAVEVHVEVPELLREMMHLARFDPADILEDDGSVIPLRKMPEHARKAIKEFEVETKYIGEDASGLPISVRVTKVKLAPKEAALKMLGQFKKLFDDDDEASKARKVSITINTNGKRGQG